MIKWYDNNISESTLEEQILNNLKKSGPFYTARWIAEGIENAVSSPVKKKHTSPDEWKKLEVYVKPGWMDPTVFVPVLVLKNGTKFTGKPINLEKASISDIVAKIKDIRAQARALGIFTTEVVSDRPLDAIEDWLIDESAADAYRYDDHFYDFFAKLSQSNVIHSFLDSIH